VKAEPTPSSSQAPAGAPAPGKDAPAKEKPAEASLDKPTATTLAAAGGPSAPKAGEDKAKPDEKPADKAAGPAPTPSKPDAKAESAKAPAADKGASGAEAAKGDERLAAYFERSAAQAGIKIKRVTSKKGAKPGKYYTPITLQLSVEGKADNVVKLLYALEKGDRFVRVEQFELHRDVAKGNTIEASLDILGYER
jgi:hypothetical protein